jgi:hypothetical protein
MHPMLLTLRQWRLTPTPIGIRGWDPVGTAAFCSTDLGDILDALGPPTAITERVGACAAGWLGLAETPPMATRPRAYICSPFAADTPAQQARHLAWARALARLAWDHGFWPVAPHLYAPQFLDDTDPAERAQGLAWGLAQLRDCAVVYVLDVSPSPGMRQELAALTPAQVVQIVPPTRLHA